MTGRSPTNRPPRRRFAAPLAAFGLALSLTVGTACSPHADALAPAGDDCCPAPPVEKPVAVDPCCETGESAEATQSAAGKTPEKSGGDDGCCPAPADADPHVEHTVTLGEIPDTIVIDQDGVEHAFRSGLLEGRTVAINFFFSTCKTICPPLTATFRKVQQELSADLGEEVRLISISVDPGNDVPARLKRFSSMFGAEEGWSFLTGNKQQIDTLLVALGAATADKFDHTPMILVGNLDSGEWRRTYGLAPASDIAAVIRGVHARAAEGRASRDAAEYFPNRVLVDQHGRSVRFYDDLLRGRAAVLHVMFTRCESICPPMLTNIAKLADLLGDRLGDEVEILSITVDPAHDTPERLLEYSKAFGAREGWRFLTGEVDDVRAVLEKLGAWVEDPDAHNAWLIIGNEATGDWRKLLATAPPLQISTLVREVLGDGETREGGTGGASNLEPTPETSSAHSKPKSSP